MARLLREPLLHFLLLGAGLFLLFEAIAGTRAPDQIVVGASDVTLLAEGFARTWQRPPTGEELAGLVADHVDEEILYREALALQLDEGDSIVRRRMRQKLEFLLDAEAPIREPSDAELEAHRLAQRERFEEPPRITLRQVYLNAGRRGGAAHSDAERLLVALQAADEGWERSGDPTSLAPEHADVDPAALASVFGAEFAARVFALPVGSWEGPIASAYGLHLVRVSERGVARLPALTELREAVLRDWQATRRAEANAKRLAELRARYEVRVEWPAAAARDGSAQ